VSPQGSPVKGRQAVVVTGTGFDGFPPGDGLGAPESMVFLQLGDGPFLPVRAFSGTSMTFDAPAAPAGVKVRVRVRVRVLGLRLRLRLRLRLGSITLSPHPNPQDVRISLNSGYDWSTGTQTSVQSFEYYDARPSALAPTGGHVRGGTLVTVGGEGFLNSINTSLFRVRLGDAGQLVPMQIDQQALPNPHPSRSPNPNPNPNPHPNPNPSPNPNSNPNPSPNLSPSPQP